ncbi:MAG TPA: formylglycine-generating enzyme family protein [Pararhizobium sp.]|nr:formylglycine-generating enzyme family protein [Pararhizobium sp.]
MNGKCCTPSRAGTPSVKSAHWGSTGYSGAHGIEQANVPAGAFLMGDANNDGLPGDGEQPVHQVRLSAFSIDATSVTNADFGQFVDETGYRTEAEIYGYSAVFHLAVDALDEDLLGRPPETPWWLGVAGADWRHPEGRRSHIEDREAHPVVHVSWNDAAAYCAWAGRRLPTEGEWEYAARGGLSGKRYPWGDELQPTGDWHCNIWQGRFPEEDEGADGWRGTAPVRSYRPNGYGLWQMVGNVWEWCADWFEPGYYFCSPADDPEGPAVGLRRVLRGGSYLCHASYCNRYRNSARSSNTPDSSASNIGFRTASIRPTCE